VKFSDDSSKKRFGKVGEVRRGYFLHEKRPDCTFKVYFKRDLAMNFTITVAYPHNHDIEAVEMMNILETKYENQLTDEEKIEITKYSIAVSNFSDLRSLIRQLIPGKNISAPLLQRLRNCALQEKFGSSNELDIAIKIGNENIKSGGTFEIGVSESGVLRDYFFQTKYMKQVSSVYNDLIFLDGTFSLTQYNWITLIFTLVDCLGHSTIAGFAFTPTENSNSAIKALKIFDLVSENTTIITDGAPAFALTASELNLNHIVCINIIKKTRKNLTVLVKLCSWHFRRTLEGPSKSLSNSESKSFLTQATKLIFEVMEVDRFDDLFNSFKEQFRNSSVYHCILKFFDNRKKVCATFTHCFFTAGHSSTQRAESVNSLIKRADLKNGNLKLSEFLDSFLALIRAQNAKSFTEIRELMLAGNHWSKYVDQKWKKSALTAASWNCKLESVKSWTVTSAANENRKFSVNILEEYCACTCPIFSAELLPCVHICAVTQKLSIDSFKKSYLHPRWHISKHPFFNEIEKMLFPSSNDVEITKLSPVFHHSKVPGTRSARHHQLSNVANQICQIGAQKNDVTYCSILAKLENLLKNVQSFDEITPHTQDIRPPPLRNKCYKVKQHNPRPISQQNSKIREYSAENAFVDDKSEPTAPNLKHKNVFLAEQHQHNSVLAQHVAPNVFPVNFLFQHNLRRPRFDLQPVQPSVYLQEFRENFK
jgi:hypothetical protein